MTRIIAGSRGGHRLATPKGDLTRPTSERVREALFSALASWLGHDGAADDALAGISFVDLYAGSGAIGLEAMSRGASPVLLVEHDRATAELIRRNAASLSLPAQVRTASVDTLARTAAPHSFDIIWLDPPYAVESAALDEIIAALVGNGWLAADGLVVLERDRRSAPPVWGAGFTDSWLRRYGETTLYYATNGAS